VRTANHELILYPDPGPFFASLEQSIDEASERVWLETYIYRDDALGAPFAEHLVAAARRGLDVRLLYDPQGSRGARPEFFARLAAAGVSVRAYRPWRLKRRRWSYWPRDHGRIVVVDRTAYTGGINWGVEWLPRAQGGDEWHDVSVAVRGPCVAEFVTVFERRWSEATDTDEIADFVAGDSADVQLVADSPAGRNLMLTRLCRAIDGAARRVWMQNSYCVPPKLLLSALSKAARRGVDVKVMVPGQSDLPSIQAATRGEYLDWVRNGLRVSEYLPRVMHSKFALVDEEWATIGTFNAISPGVWWANETNVIVRDRGFVTELARVFETDLGQSALVTPAWVARRPFRARLWDKLVARSYRLVEWLVVQLTRGPFHRARVSDVDVRT
jgi:cardiolipin synthase